MRQLILLQTAKALVAELDKTKDSYGHQIDKYQRKIEVSAKFSWYYGSYGNSSVYDVPSLRNLEQALVNKAVNNFLTQHFDEVVRLIAKEHEKAACTNLDSLIKQKENIEEILKLAGGH